MTRASKQSRRAYRHLLAGSVRLGMLAYLVSWLGMGTVTELVHLRFADHGHWYCPEHQQIEETTPSSGGDQEGASHVFGEDGPFLRADAAPTAQDHVSCTFLNSVSSRSSVSTSARQPSPARCEVTQRVSATRETIAVSFPLLFVAPKQSPPSSSC